MFNDDENDDRPAEEEEDFASMLEASLEPKVFNSGDMVEGRVVSVGKEAVFVDIGGKGEATIDSEELRDPDGNLDVEVGDIVQGIVVSTSGGLKLSHKLARGAADLRRLEEAYAAGLPVEGRVDKSNRGGFEIHLGGKRAFCPISQIDTGYTDDPEKHVGSVYTFRIIEFKEGGKNVVLSRRSLLEEAERERAAEVRKTIVPGAILPGRVASVRDYGAFVDLGGGIQGLLHVSEMGWSRVSNPRAVVQSGDEIDVKVLGVDDEKGRISLGLKQLLADPWDAADDTYEEGQLLKGRVTRVAEFGAFIELEPGIEALAHASTFTESGKRDAWKALVQPGTDVAVKLLSCDFDQKRIGVAVVDEDVVEEHMRPTLPPAAPGEEANGSPEGSGGGFGSLADKLRAALGQDED
ncbi:MAG: S1 RNA-binding domain-containing protein [bacterium]|nr:S1 RNA-binding domain-containing protein [bacterium]